MAMALAERQRTSRLVAAPATGRTGRRTNRARTGPTPAGVLRAGLLLASLLAVAAPAAAWSGPVHELVCEMAWQQLAPATKRWLREVRSGERSPGSFAASCVWADRVRDGEHRDSYEYHFVNIARGANGFDPARDCAAFDCTPAALHRYLRYLIAPASGERMRVRRARALKFLAHFVADLHQPLHAGYGEDRGGNDIQVQWTGESGWLSPRAPGLGTRPRIGAGAGGGATPGAERHSLHSLFDGELAAAAGLADVGAAPRLVAAIGSTDAARWRKGDVAAWTNESFVLARDHAYRVGRDGRVDAVEARALAPLLVQQVQKASVRLAWLLDEAAHGRFALAPLW